MKVLLSKKVEETIEVSTKQYRLDIYTAHKVTFKEDPETGHAKTEPGYNMVTGFRIVKQNETGGEEEIITVPADKMFEVLEAALLIVNPSTAGPLKKD